MALRSSWFRLPFDVVRPRRVLSGENKFSLKPAERNRVISRTTQPRAFYPLVVQTLNVFPAAGHGRHSHYDIYVAGNKNGVFIKNNGAKLGE